MSPSQMQAEDHTEETAPRPLVVLSGFLGAGKTSLLVRLAEAGELAGTLVLVNEAGDVSIDGALLRAARAEVMDLSGGAACCLYDDEDDLLASLQRLSTLPQCRRVVLETSGLAHPAGLVALLRGASLSSLVSLSGFAVVVDGTRAASYFSRFEEARAQVQAADRAVVSKIEANSPSALAVEGLLRGLNPVLTRPCSTADSPAALSQWLWAPRTIPWPPISSVHDHASVFSVSLVDYAAYDLAGVLDVLESISPQLLRVKGFVHEPGRGDLAFIEWAGLALSVTRLPPVGRSRPRTELVVIAAGEESAQAILQARLKACRARSR